ncbi:MAG: hypothetical protein ABSC92_03505, partial [Rhizomicrobium sp.]
MHRVAIRQLAIVSILLIFAGAAAWGQGGVPAHSFGILILGDSNSEGPFGGTLYDALLAKRLPGSDASINVKMFAKCGAGANDWIERDAANIDCGAWICDEGRPASSCRHSWGGTIPTLPELYDELHAERRVTLVVLGLNMIIGRRAQKLDDATNLIAAIHAQHSACIWVGPPQPGNLFVPPGEYESFVGDLERTVTRNGCRYISSDDKTDRHDLGENTKDDHYSKPDAEAWARKVLY